MTWGKFFFWSTVLTLPTLFLPRKRPGVVAPGPETEGPDGPIVSEPSAPPEPLPLASEVETMPASFQNFRAPSLPGYSRMKSSEVPAEVMSQLRPLLAKELGAVTKLSTSGRDIVAVIEPHYHTPGGPTKPWGWHKGVSLYERKGQVA